MKTGKICLFGHFGLHNWGNDSTVRAMLCNLRVFRPGTAVVCICTNPEALAATEKIEAVPIRREFGPSERRPIGFAWFFRKIFIGLPREMARWFEMFRTLKGANMLIIPGTGLLTDAYGLQGWGPYNLFKWSLVAKLRGAKLVFLSVGAGPFYSGRGKWLVKQTLGMADFRSYRDRGSMNCLKEIGLRTNGDRVYPDLAFSLPETALPRHESRIGRRRVVGLGLMSNPGKYNVPNPTCAIHHRYLENLVFFAEWLLARNCDIRLLTGDLTDRSATQEFRTLLKKRSDGISDDRVVEAPVASVDQILSELAETDVVVATRFHNVLLALLLHKPTIAITFHDKCTSLMSQMGLSEYTHNINDMNADKLIGQFLDLEKKTEELKYAIRQKIEQSRRALDEQYNLIFENR